MFRKQFTIKSYTNLRHSERKTIFPCAINSCFNAKQQVARILVALPTSNVCLYVLDKEPLFFQCPSDNTIFPTVYFLWSASFDSQFPVLFVHAAVLPILQNGSDLMIPGILLEHPFADFEANAPVAIAIITEERGAPVGYGLVAVGQALISASELRTKRQAGDKGKAIKILHIYGDFLWEYGSKKKFGSKKLVTFGQENAAAAQHGRVVDEQCTDHEAVQSSSSLSVAVEPVTEKCQEYGDEGVHEKENVQANMDELLKNTFFAALRWKFGPNGPLPIDAGQFYANYILKCLPPARILDIKKTKFKKFSTFLRELITIDDDPANWVVRMKSLKGVDTIEEFNINHPLVQSAPELVHNADATAGSFVDGQPLLSIRDNVFSLTEKVMPIFRSSGFKKGDIVDLNRIRAVLGDYAQKQNLYCNGGKEVRLDDTLQPIVQHFLYETFDVNKLVQKIANAMTPAILVKTKEDKQIVHRGTKQPHIDLKIEKRAGNKQVTLVSNLAAFCIDVNMLDSKISGTGTSILASAPACDGPQLMVQGNEINRIGRFLADFGVPKKFINGLEQGIKEPKKKKK
uniref:SUI1 domain-containing protein n=1 Tax=Globodera pallida TaxID=36090 RepID=A0A183C2M6_GLOPA